MPKNPVDYSKTIIYQIKCLDDVDFVYVGHTTNFKSRKSDHKKVANSLDYKESHYKIYQTIRDNGGWENWEMIPLEEFACNSSTEARIKEQEWIDKLQTNMNTRKAFLTQEEHREWSYNYNNNWRLANPEKQKQMRNNAKKMCDCPCGGKYSLNHKARHFESSKHKNWWFMAFS
jgi:hypothetical protein